MNKFECPSCKTKSKLSKHLRASWTCPKCRASMVIQDEWQKAGHIVGEYEMSNYLLFAYKPIYNNYKK